MIVELLVVGDDGVVRAVRLQATQVVVRNSVATPILAVAAEYGPGRAQLIGHIGDPDFHTVLRRLGIYETPRLDLLQVERPAPGARLIAGPRNTKDGEDNG